MSNEFDNFEKNILDILEKRFEEPKILTVDFSSGTEIETVDGIYTLVTVKNPECAEYEELRESLSKLYQSLKNGGVLLIHALNPENIRVSTEIFYENPYRKQMLPLKATVALAKEAGFVRSTIIRDETNEYLETKLYFDISDVVNAVSAGYTLIAQKEGEDISFLDDIFSLKRGISLDEALSRFEKRELNDKKHIDILRDKISVFDDSVEEFGRESKKIRELVREIDKLKQSISRYEENTALLNQKLNSSDEEIAKLKELISKYDRERSSIKGELKILNMKLDEMRQENSEFRHFVHELAHDHHGLSKAFHQLHTHVNMTDKSCFAVKQCFRKVMENIKRVFKKKEINNAIITDSTDGKTENRDKSDPDFTVESEIRYSVERPILNAKPLLEYATKKSIDKNSKPSLAYFSPFEPAKSGIATYTSELLPHLSEYYDITLVADSDNMDAQRVYDGIEFELISVDEFTERADRFDRVLHHIGNSHYHIYSCKTLERFAGVIVLHDFYLSGMQKYREFENGDDKFWGLSLFKGHGYLPFRDYFSEKNYEKLSFEYPVNLQVLQRSLGVITHSEYAEKLSDEWYIKNILPQWSVVPHLREVKESRDKKGARAKLGIDESAFVICSFGHINKTKLSHRLLNAFIASSLSRERNVKLIFAGHRSDPDYCKKMEETAQKEGVADKVEITGWIEMDEFNLYLQASDIAVQLRTLSRGETSGTVLDALSYGLPVIVNANGSMAELERDAVYMLDDDFADSELIEALDELYRSQELRERLSQQGIEYLKRNNRPEHCAELYRDAIERFYESVKSQDYTKIDARPRQRQILVDVSTLVMDDLRTGVQRVVRAQLLQLMEVVPKSWRVEAVYLSLEGKPHYRYASDYLCRLLDIPVSLSDTEVEISAGDIFYGVDLYRYGVLEAAKAGVYEEYREKGVCVSFTIHDLLPIDFPHFFPEGTKEEHIEWLEAITKNSDMLVCTSETGAKITKESIEKLSIVPKEEMPKIVSVHLGADISSSAPDGTESKYSSLIEEMSKIPLFLMVGTVEPRKGHLQTIKAFEKLWSDGIEAALVVIGKEGWRGLPDEARRNLPETVKALKEAEVKHGDRFRWLTDVDDVSLEEFYRKSTVFLFASEDEGFGIPLIEAAHYGLPLLVRDREIFRELAGEYAEYFEDSLDENVLAEAIKHWLEAYGKGETADSKGMPCITWQESAERLYREFAGLCEEKS